MDLSICSSGDKSIIVIYFLGVGSLPHHTSAQLGQQRSLSPSRWCTLNFITITSHFTWFKIMVTRLYALSSIYIVITIFYSQMNEWNSVYNLANQKPIADKTMSCTIKFKNFLMLRYKFLYLNPFVFISFSTWYKYVSFFFRNFSIETKKWPIYERFMVWS